MGTSFVPWLFVLLWDVGSEALAFPIALGLAPAVSLVLTLRLHAWAEQVGMHRRPPVFMPLLARCGALADSHAR